MPVVGSNSWAMRRGAAIILTTTAKETTMHNDMIAALERAIAALHAQAGPEGLSETFVRSIADAATIRALIADLRAGLLVRREDVATLNGDFACAVAYDSGHTAGAAQERAKVVAFQQGVDAWMDACFGRAIKADMLERADRFCEEALELCQTVPGFGAERAHALVDYVFNRAVGERRQEVGGVMVTLAALCNAAEINMEDAGKTELARVWTKVEAIRAKQAAKPTGSALPVAIAAGAHEGGGDG